MKVFLDLNKLKLFSSKSSTFEGFYRTSVTCNVHLIMQLSLHGGNERDEEGALLSASVYMQ